MPLPELVRTFLERTGLPTTELGRRATDPTTGKPMTPNTINNVKKGGRYDEETERRLRRAIDEYVAVVQTFSGQGNQDVDAAAADLARDDT